MLWKCKCCVRAKSDYNNQSSFGEGAGYEEGGEWWDWGWIFRSQICISLFFLRNSMLPERSAELRRGKRWVWGGILLASTSGPWQAEVNCVILSLMIALAGKGEVVICSCVWATPANGKDRKCLISRVLQGWGRGEGGCCRRPALTAPSPLALRSFGASVPSNYTS